MISEGLFLLLVGAGIALASSLLTLVLQHFLSLREEKIRRKRDREEKEKDLLEEAESLGLSPEEHQEVLDKVDEIIERRCRSN